MGTMKWIGIVVVGSITFALAGCQSPPSKPIPGSTQVTTTGASTTSAASMSTGSGRSLSAEIPPPVAGPKSSYKNRTVYFAFNKSIIKPEYFPLLKNQANYLLAHANARVLLEGYTDDRGTWAYNIGLGSRRAAAVENFLLLQGVTPGQIKTISYGEAYPADPANNPLAWAKNRRVVINYSAGKSS